MLFPIFILALLGFGISLYIYMLEQKVKRNPEYKPVCDISDRVSCTKPMKSPYAHYFYFSNAVLSMGFYFLMIIFAFLETEKLVLLGSLCACVVSCVLAYFLYFKVKSFCLLCTSLYIINILLLLVSLGLL